VDPLPSQQTSATFTITVDDLSKRFNREWIFRHLDFQFQAGKTYTVTGPNGSGKSTLLQVVWGQVPQTTGSFRYEKGKSEIPIDEVFRHISIATPYMELIEEFTLNEMLSFHFRLRKVRTGFTFDHLLPIMYLEDAAEKQLMNFSSGMKQRLKLGLALYTEADVYFLDEPGTNLDRRAFDWYRNELSKLPPHAMVLIASNNPDEYPENATNLSIVHYKR
jgi:ABC-type multidrug transport system ATPase subunit